MINNIGICRQELRQIESKESNDIVNKEETNYSILANTFCKIVCRMGHVGENINNNTWSLLTWTYIPLAELYHINSDLSLAIHKMSYAVSFPLAVFKSTMLQIGFGKVFGAEKTLQDAMLSSTVEEFFERHIFLNLPEYLKWKKNLEKEHPYIYQAYMGAISNLTRFISDKMAKKITLFINS